MKIQMKKLQIISIFVIIWSSFSLFNVITIKAAETKPTLCIEIHKIQKIDDIEGFLEGEPDWQYFIDVWNGESWDTIDNRLDTSTDPIIVNEVHFFEVTTTVIQIRIRLWDLETVGSPDLADISGYLGGGLNDWGGGTIPRGAQYYGTYNIKTNSLSGDTTYVEEGYYKTSGDYDGSTATDENDANLWFNIGDNYDAPKADADLNRECNVGEKLNFDGSGSEASSGSSIIRYEWDFDGDGVVDAEGEKTSFTFSSEGKYTVKLKVTDSIGETDTDTCKVTVIKPIYEPTAEFTYSPLEYEPTILDTVYFYDTSRDLDGSIVSWSWNFGDGHTSTIKDPTHKYTDKGTYIVTLTVTDNDGYRASKDMIITVINLAPTADFTYSPSSPKVETDIQFTDRSTDPEGKTLEYLWDFGDGFTSSMRNPKHPFAKAGTKRVKLTVTDDEDASDSITKSIIIVENPLPSADFSHSPDNQKMNHDVQFTDQSSDDGYIVEWFWNFGDGTTSTQENPTHKFGEGGEYVVRLTVTDDNGDIDEVAKKVNIIQTYDLTLQVKDFLGLNIANVNIALYTNGECCASGSTDEKGELCLTEIPEGNYEIQAKVMGVTTSKICSLSQSKTEQIQTALSINTIGITGAIIAVVALLGFYLKRKGKTSLPAEEMKREEEAVPEEAVSLKLKKRELEIERINEMLKTFKEKFDKGEIDEETYLRLKEKYEKELKRLEEKK